VRVKDFQEVGAQALRSRRQFPNTTLWAELANRLSGQGQPVATLVEGSGDAGLLSRRLGLTDDDVESAVDTPISVRDLAPPAQSPSRD
jgi:hypothetical protein